MSFISRYSDLRTLELGAISPASWQQLYKMVAEICSPHFRELVLRYDAVADTEASIAPNTVETSPVDYALRVKLPTVERVCFVVVYSRTAFGKDAEWRDGVTARVRSCFRRLAEAGKLQIEFERAKKVNTPHHSVRCTWAGLNKSQQNHRTKQQQPRQPEDQTAFRTSRNRIIAL